VGISGLLIGFAVSTLAYRYRVLRVPGQSIVERMSRDLQLTPAQRDRVGDILRESLGHEKKTLMLYEKLLELVQGEDVMLEEFAREHIYLEHLHVGEVDKMLRRPGDIESVEKAGKK